MSDDEERPRKRRMQRVAPAEEEKKKEKKEIQTGRRGGVKRDEIAVRTPHTLCYYTGSELVCMLCSVQNVGNKMKRAELYQKAKHEAKKAHSKVTHKGDTHTHTHTPGMTTLSSRAAL